MSAAYERVAKGQVSIDGIDYIPMPTLSELRDELSASREREERLREALEQCEALLANVTRLELSPAAPGQVDPERGPGGQGSSAPPVGPVWQADGGERLPLWYVVHEVLKATARQPKDDV